MRKILTILLSILLVASLVGCDISSQTNVEGLTLVALGNESWYFYNQLADDEKLIYDEIFRQANDFGEFITFSTSEISGKIYDKNTCSKIIQAFRDDHPEFYTLSYEYFVKFEDDTFNIWLGEIDLEEYKKTYDLLNTTANEMIGTIPANATEYEKAKAIYKMVINHIEYEGDEISSRDIRGALLYNNATAGGYARTFNFLCSKAGLESTLIRGVANDGYEAWEHYWNAVKIDGEWYWVDTMLGSEYIDKIGKSLAYFALTDEEFFLNHSLKTIENGELVSPEKLFEYPKCTSNAIEKQKLVDNFTMK